LSITKALVEMLGGKIAAEGAPGGGSIFRVVIPEAQNAGADIFAEDGNEFLFGNESKF
jgi:signal transduction histidine kinase